VYQAEFGFSALMLTAVFAVYVLALLSSLLTVGRLSDFLGRRPVLAVALVVEALAMATFADAHGVAALLVARLVQGLATGAAIGVLGAWLLDLQPPDGSRLGSLVNSAAATGGLGVGTVVSGVLLQYGPRPTRLVFVILTWAFLGLAATARAVPETVRPVPGAVAALRPRVSVPPAARGAFARALPTMASTWMLGGLIFSVGGSLLAVVFGQHNHAVVGLVLGGFAASAALSSITLRDREPHEMERIGTAGVLTGTLVFIAGLEQASLPVFVLGMMVAGAGFGPAFLGAFRTLSQLAPAHERAGLISAVYVASYLAFSIPALVAGVLITRDGLRGTAFGYGAVVAGFAALTLMIDAFQARRLTPEFRVTADLPRPHDERAAVELLDRRAGRVERWPIAR